MATEPKLAISVPASDLAPIRAAFATANAIKHALGERALRFALAEGEYRAALTESFRRVRESNAEIDRLVALLRARLGAEGHGALDLDRGEFPPRAPGGNIVELRPAAGPAEETPEAGVTG